MDANNVQDIIVLLSYRHNISETASIYKTCLVKPKTINNVRNNIHI